MARARSSRNLECGRHAAPAARGFSLTEMLIVIGIVVLIATIAVPSFRAMTGTRSTEAAHNQLSALLGRARGEAISLQKVHGVAFFIDPDNAERIQAAMVVEAPRPLFPDANVDVYLDLLEGRDVMQMPPGVGLQMLDDCNINLNDPANPEDNVRLDDGYIGFNVDTANGTDVTYGGAILFDGYGRVVSKRFAWKCYNEDAAGAKLPTLFAKTWEMNVSSAMTNLVPLIGTGPNVLRSQFGFVVYDLEAFTNSTTVGGTAFGLDDAQMTGTPYTSAENEEERWLDVNSTPELVNRNNGTLVTGE